MSLTNPKNVITEERLSEFYNRILPYLGGSADAGFTPVGTVISVMGVTAPTNYLACNGQTVNVADYPELANYFEQQFGTKYKFGGSGTTFGIPNLKGEFLRGTGTNGHSGQGSGSAVGTHQDATQVPVYTTNNAETSLIFPVHATGSESTKPKVVNKDSESSTGDAFGNLDFKSKTSGSSPCRITTRPTNTSVLFCIATKNIYLNPSLDYSKDEKVVGSYFNGKTLYQKTIEMTVSVDTNGTAKEVALDVSDLGIETIARMDAVMANISALPQVLWTGSLAYITRVYHNFSQNKLVLASNRLDDNGKVVRINIQYTKTSD